MTSVPLWMNAMKKIGRKIRDNEMKRIPYMLVVGEKEAETRKLLSASREKVIKEP
mgnify:CR=1 FL=1